MIRRTSSCSLFSRVAASRIILPPTKSVYAAAMRFSSDKTAPVKNMNKKDLFADDGADDDGIPAASILGGASTIGTTYAAEPKAAQKNPSERPMMNIGVDPNGVGGQQPQQQGQVDGSDVDVAAAGGGGGGGSAVRLEVQVTVMQSQLTSIEKRLDDLSDQRAQLLRNREQSGGRAAVDAELSAADRTAAPLSAQWMSTALNLAGLLEAEEGHLEEVCVLLDNVLEKLNRPHYLVSVKQHSSSEFFSDFQDSLRVGALLRLARAELDLGRTEASLKSCVAAKEIVFRAVRNGKTPPVDAAGPIFAHLLNSPSILEQWLCLCKLQAMALDAAERPVDAQEFLSRCLCVDELLSGDVVIVDSLQRNNAVGERASVITIDAAKSKQREEALLYVELLMRHADSLGLSADGKGWRKPEDPVFVRKRKLLNAISYAFSAVLSPTHPIVNEARAALALDCGGVAVTRAESRQVLEALISDVRGELDELAKTAAATSQEQAREAAVSAALAGDSVKDQEVSARKHALLVWQRKLGIVVAEMGDYPEAARVLEATSAECDRLLGIHHEDSISTLRCWARALYLSRKRENKPLFEKLSAEIENRGAPPSI